MDSNFELEGMNEFMEQIQNMGEKADPAIKKAVKAGGEIVKVNLIKKIPRSKVPRAPNNGANSWRSGEHAVDHIRISKPLGKDGNFYTLIGISRADAHQWFYLKFLEYGTSKQPALAPFGRTVAETKNEVAEAMTDILKEELDL
jgi:HK97 gp10 family phage protein